MEASARKARRRAKWVIGRGGLEQTRARNRLAPVSGRRRGVGVHRARVRIPKQMQPGAEPAV